MKEFKEKKSNLSGAQKHVRRDVASWLPNKAKGSVRSPVGDLMYRGADFFVIKEIHDNPKAL